MATYRLSLWNREKTKRFCVPKTVKLPYSVQVYVHLVQDAPFKPTGLFPLLTSHRLPGSLTEETLAASIFSSMFSLEPNHLSPVISIQLLPYNHPNFHKWAFLSFSPLPLFLKMLKNVFKTIKSTEWAQDSQSSCLAKEAFRPAKFPV